MEFPTITDVLTSIEGEEHPMQTTHPRFNVDMSTVPVNEEQVHPSMREISEEQAGERLERMLDMPGMLQIITGQCAVDGCVRAFDPTTGRVDMVHDESVYEVTDHRHFIKHTVVEIDQEPPPSYIIRAHTAEGDWTLSPSGARSLLRHLTRVSMGSG